MFDSLHCYELLGAVYYYFNAEVAFPTAILIPHSCGLTASVEPTGPFHHQPNK